MRELLTTIQSLRSDKITLRTDGQDARKSVVHAAAHRNDSSLRFLLACLWAMNLPRWCWPCCDRRPPAQKRARPIEKGAAQATATSTSRSLHEPVLPQLPLTWCRALSLMAILNPEDQDHGSSMAACSRRKSPSARSWRAHGLFERRGVRRRLHGAQTSKPTPARPREAKLRRKRRSTCSSSAAARLAAAVWRGAQGHSHGSGGRAPGRPG